LCISFSLLTREDKLAAAWRRNRRRIGDEGEEGEEEARTQMKLTACPPTPQDVCVKCTGHTGHKLVEASFAKLFRRTASTEVKATMDTFISRTRSAAMENEAGHALAVFRRTASSSAIDRNARTATQRMDVQAEELKNKLRCIDSTMSRATAILEEASRLFRDWFKGLSHDGLHSRIREAFAQFDLDGGGSLDKEEFRDAWRRMGGKELTAEEVEAFFSKYDTDGTGTIDEHEFKHLVLVSLDEPCSPQCRSCEQGPINNQNERESTACDQLTCADEPSLRARSRLAGAESTREVLGDHTASADTSRLVVAESTREVSGDHTASADTSFDVSADAQGKDGTEEEESKREATGGVMGAVSEANYSKSPESFISIAETLGHREIETTSFRDHTSGHHEIETAHPLVTGSALPYSPISNGDM